MLSKELEDLIEEFILIENNEKFKRKYYCYFKNGVCTNLWFKKYQNEIFSSNDERCKLVRKQYDEYIEVRKSQILKYKKAFYEINFNKTMLLKEFLLLEKNSKFDPSCDIYLSNRMNAYAFFIKIIDDVMNSKDPLYKKARLQYFEYKEKKVKLQFKKELLSFYKEKRIGKFDPNSNIKLQTGQNAGFWFNNNKDIILSSKGPIEMEISKQYETFLVHYFLAEEFLKETNMDKFDMDSNVRFSSRALMNIWWEDNEAKMRCSDLNIDDLIIEQYNQYVNKKKF